MKIKNDRYRIYLCGGHSSVMYYKSSCLSLDTLCSIEIEQIEECETNKYDG